MVMVMVIMMVIMCVMLIKSLLIAHRLLYIAYDQKSDAFIISVT